jgi:hypothetical protein
MARYPIKLRSGDARLEPILVLAFWRFADLRALPNADRSVRTTVGDRDGDMMVMAMVMATPAWRSQPLGPVLAHLSQVEQFDFVMPVRHSTSVA